MKEATLCHPVVDDELLLIRKRRGLGAGKLVGPGGTVEAGETPRECVVREVREELRVGVEPERVGAFTFSFGAGIEMLVHVYRTEHVDGEPTATPEAEPVWVDADAIPYDEMWVDDRHWLPILLAGGTFSGHFAFDADGDALLDWWVREGDDPGGFAAAVREGSAALVREGPAAAREGSAASERERSAASEREGSAASARDSSADGGD